MKEIGLLVSPQLLLEGNHTMESGMAAMSALATLAGRPSAVVCSNDLTAIGVMREAYELGLEIPRDLSVIGFDDIRLAQFIIPPLTTVQMSRTAIAGTAFNALLECVEPEWSSPKMSIINTNLVLRRTTALAPDRRKKAAGGENQTPTTDGFRERSQPPFAFA
jgi:LacI family transcriptional regulator